jgi:hypothetical protein
MNIEQAQYLENNALDEPSGIKAVIDGQTMYVSISPANRHYAEIMRQVEAGTLTIAEAD